MSKSAKYIRTNDLANEFADTLLDKLEQEAVERVDELYTTPSVRNVELWNKFRAPVDLSVSDFEAVDDVVRDLDWVEGMSSISSSSRTQVFLENRSETIIKPLAYREQTVGQMRLTRAELLQAGRRTADLASLPSSVSFETLQAKYLNDLSFLSQLDDVELYEALLDFGAVLPPEKMIAQSSGYPARMMSYRSGSPQFKEELSSMIRSDARNGLREMQRRSTMHLSAHRESNGDLNQLMMWLLEASPRTCDHCQIRGGEVATFAQWIDRGLPGDDVCKGGNRCRCQLVAI